MTVRSTRLWGKEVANNNTDQTMFTCPTGYRAIIKSVGILNKSGSAVVVDEFELLAPPDITWAWLHNVTIDDGDIYPHYMGITQTISGLDLIPLGQLMLPVGLMAHEGDHVHIIMSTPGAAVWCFGHGSLLALP